MRVIKSVRMKNLFLTASKILHVDKPSKYFAEIYVIVIKVQLKLECLKAQLACWPIHINIHRSRLKISIFSFFSDMNYFKPEAFENAKANNSVISHFVSDVVFYPKKKICKVKFRSYE